MAPRQTRPIKTSTTRKRGESDPKEAPKKRRTTRNSKGGSDEESKAEKDDVGRSAARVKKGSKRR